MELFGEVPEEGDALNQLGGVYSVRGEGVGEEDDGGCGRGGGVEGGQEGKVARGGGEIVATAVAPNDYLFSFRATDPVSFRPIFQGDGFLREAVFLCAVCI